MRSTPKLLTKINLERILVIRRDNIGDLVCTTPAFAALRKHYPNAEIGALVNSYNADVLRGNPNVDHIFVYQKLKHTSGFIHRFKAISQRLSLILRLRKWKPSVAILAKSSYDRHGLNLALQIGVKTIIGYVPIDLSEARRLPHIRLATPEPATLHEVEAVNQLLKPLGITDAPGQLQVFADPNIVSRITQWLPPAAHRIGLHISAREPERRWGIDNFIALAKHILDTQPNAQILLFWSPGMPDDRYHPGDDEAAVQLIQAIQSERLVPMPAQRLPELIAALSCCDLFIGADGGAMHLAAALNRGVIALFENLPCKLKHWYPWHVINQVVHSDNAKKPNVDQISQLKVAQALERL